MPFGTDEILWYNVGTWGELGYATPNFGDNVATLNSSIAYLVNVMGRNLFSIMHHADADMRTPPSINTLIRVHKLIVRARSILSSRALSAATPRMEAVHATPAQEPFVIYPVPYFRVRNAYLKEWAQLVLNAIGEACQHTENRIEYEISQQFAGTVGQYLQRVYVRMSVELFGVALADAQKADFTLTDTILASYDPSKWFTSTELVDTAPKWIQLATEDDLEPLANGIPAAMLTGLARYPRGELLVNGTQVGNDAAPAAAATGAFLKAPGP